MTRTKPTALLRLARYTDLLVAGALVVIIGMMIVPIPEWMLDVLLTLNVSIALTVLLVAMYTIKPLDFSSFPSLLLVSTLFRLGLNIAATRAVLLNASAGSVVGAFGSVVVGGNYVVGIVVFAILVSGIVAGGSCATRETRARGDVKRLRTEATRPLLTSPPTLSCGPRR